MKRFTALLGGCAMLALTACGNAGEEEPAPMELGPDTAQAVTTIDIAQGDIGSALCIGASRG